VTAARRRAPAWVERRAATRVVSFTELTEANVAPPVAPPVAPAVDPQLPLDLDAVTAADVDGAPVQTWSWQLWIDGRPAPQGSKNPMPIYAGTGAERRIVGYTMVESSRKYLKPWRDTVTKLARAAWTVDPYAGPVVLGCAFLISTPQDVRAGDWAIKKSGPFAGDLSHLVRAVEDALKDAKVLVDDCLVVGYLGYPQTGKRYVRPGESPGCHIILRPAYPVPEQWDGFKPPIRRRPR
jgi:Holliday junction resolvase RusA-like endonuclease